MIKIILLFFAAITSGISVNDIYARASVVIDGENGRVLYGKNYDEVLANASTTKILTCIVALENSKMDDVLTVSDYASSMPDVKLGVKKGQRYYMRDMLYAMMLESDNDVSVVVAEGVAGDTESFAKLLNEKARDIGCKNTYFITPNGLDRMDENGMHSTTAYDLALIMKYCIDNKQFLEITRTKSHSFSDVDNTKSYVVNNKNSFLFSYNGMISGKTGFTSKAGYCYVGAANIDNKKFVFSILASGWPPNKNYKWSDAKKMLDYCDKTYERYSLENYDMDEDVLQDIDVENGVKKHIDLCYGKKLEGYIIKKKNEKITVKYDIEKRIKAPIKKGECVGFAIYRIGDTIIDSVPLLTDEKIEVIDYRKCLQKVLAILPF